MSPHQFVDAVKIAVARSSANGILQYLHRPPGRRPGSDAVEISAWYGALEKRDRERIQQIVEWSADQAVYNFLLLLDGLVTFEASEQKGRLELFYHSGNVRSWLNNPQSQALTDLYKASGP